jgi:hypothetical protein
MAQATVVSFAHDGLVIYFGCGANSQKAQNLARDPRVSLTMTPPYGDDWMAIRGLSMAARATEVTDATEMTRVGGLMAARFPQITSLQPAEPFPIKVFRIVPEVVSVLDYALGFGHTDLVRIEPGDIAVSLGGRRERWLFSPAEVGTAPRGVGP